MTDFEDQHSVWTSHDNSEWSRRNGTSDLVLVDTLSLGRARFLCERLLMTRPDGEFWIKDIHGEEVTRFRNSEVIKGAPDPRPEPRRRRLGTRGA